MAVKTEVVKLVPTPGLLVIPPAPVDVEIQYNRDLVQSRDIWRKAYEGLRAQFEKVVDWYKTPVVPKP